MTSLGFYKGLLIFLGIVLLGMAVFWGMAIYQTWRDYDTFRVKEVNYRQQLAEARRIQMEREAYLNRLLSDQAFFEKVVRERLGYSRENELIFRFKEQE